MSTRSHQPSAISRQHIAEQLCYVNNILASFRRVIVAYSGGVDSTLLAKLARDVLGKPHALAVTADSASLARADLAEAIRLAQMLDLEHRVIPTGEVRNPAYQVNALGRCYVCKRTLFIELEALARREDAEAILYGAIGDDLAAERPGQRAASERGVRAPLQEAGCSKVDIRLMAKALGLPNWDRPQNACLSSRVPHGSAVTEDKLRQIEAAEAFLLAQGFRQVRVRHLGTHARIEVEVEALGRFTDQHLCQRIIDALSPLGFSSVGVDRAGYHSGGADDSKLATRNSELSLTAV